MADSYENASIDNFSVCYRHTKEVEKKSGISICTGSSRDSGDISYPPDLHEEKEHSETGAAIFQNVLGDHSAVQQQAKARRESESSGSDEAIEEVGSIPSFDASPCVTSGNKPGEGRESDQFMKQLNFDTGQIPDRSATSDSDSNSMTRYSLALPNRACDVQSVMMSPEHEDNLTFATSGPEIVRGETLRSDEYVERPNKSMEQEEGRCTTSNSVSEPQRSMAMFFKEFMDQDDRLKSLVNWKRKRPTKEAIAHAGFFYEGDVIEAGKLVTNRVYCYKCGNSLALFEEDDPMVQHDTLWPECQNTIWK